MKIIFALVIVVPVFYSCKKQGDAGTAVYGVLIHYVDSSGKSLYSNDGENGYWRDSIKVYDITGSKKTLPNCYENTANYQFQQPNVLRTTICENTDIVNRYSYTLIHLKSGVDDTVKCHIDHDNIGPSTRFDAIWYNGVLKSYDSTGNITVLK